MTSVLQQAVRRQDQRQQARAADFQQLIIDLANDKHVGADRVDEVLASAGKTAADLNSAVSRYKLRKAKFAKVLAAEAAEQELQGIQQQYEQLNAELQAAKDRHRDAVLPLRRRADQLTQQIQEGTSARIDLQRDCSDPRRLEEAMGLALKLRELGAEKAAIGEKVYEVKGKINALTARIEEGGSNAAAYKADLADVKSRLANYNARTKELDAEILDVQQQSVEAHQQLAEP